MTTLGMTPRDYAQYIVDVAGTYIDDGKVMPAELVTRLRWVERHAPDLHWRALASAVLALRRA